MNPFDLPWQDEPIPQAFDIAAELERAARKTRQGGNGQKNEPPPIGDKDIPGMVGEARPAKNKKKPEDFYDKIEGIEAEYLMNMEFEEPRWVVNNKIPEGVIIFAGKPKAGKSVLALNLCVAVATGGICLGEDIEPGAVLYLHLEDNQRRIQRRLKAMLSDDQYTGSYPKGLDQLHLYYKWPRIGQGGLRALDMFIAEHKCRLVVIDTFKMFQPVLTRSDEKKVQYEIDYDRLATLREITEKHRTTIMPIMHARKQASDDPIDMISGTLGISGAVDNVMVLFDRKGTRAKLFVQGRDVDNIEYTLEYSLHNWLWTLLGESSKVMATDTQQAVLDFVKEFGSRENPLTPTQIVDGSGATKTYVSGRLLPQMLKDGLIAKIAHGKYYAK